ncbi:DUF1559 domain-containing protein [Lentisphaera marina]|uniref:DUF1559 family PulG-like putative transporter n=1 Tax=Lentisphaera marina TaxID=1111041 RepID=UPI002366FB6B|nr:DUF1559 domain-containing protein [Lentisphaera marina]MDD7987279.1 DUF1559 domain-containing protein [Lentisphaera marina]
MKAKKKFTLIEILVVVAIIGILASLLLPSLKRAREKARLASCINNQKQIAISFALYQDDSEGHYPIYGTTFEDDISWDDMLSDYDGREISDADKLTEELRIDEYSAGSYLCPSTLQNRDPILIKSYAINDSYVQDDMSNANAIRGTAGWKNDAGWSMKISDVQNSSNFIVLSEVNFWSNKMGSTGAWGEVGAREWCDGLSVAKVVSRQKNEDKGGLGGFFIHDSKSYKLNFLFGDGHVEFRSVPSTLGDGASGFYDGSAPSWSNFVDTPWNALSE